MDPRYLPVVNIVYLPFNGNESNLPASMEYNLNSWRRNGHVVQTWNEFQILQLIQADADLTRIFKRPASWIARQEIAKYIVAYKLGGLCADTCAECVKPVDFSTQRETLWVTPFNYGSNILSFLNHAYALDNIFSTSVLVSKTAQSPILHRLLFKDISGLVEVQNMHTGIQVMESYGPIAFSKRLQQEDKYLDNIHILGEDTVIINEHVAYSWFPDLADATTAAENYVNQRDTTNAIAIGTLALGSTSLLIAKRKLGMLISYQAAIIIIVVAMYMLYLAMGKYAGLMTTYLKWKHRETLSPTRGSYLPYLYDSSDARFTFLSPLQQNWHAIRDEAVLALRSAPVLDLARSKNEWVQSGDQIKDNMKSYGWVSAWQVDSDDKNTDWLNYGIMFNGSFFEKNIEHCPVLAACLEPIANRINICGFSLMRPCTKIQRHTDSTGLSYGSLAYHLGLCVPDDAPDDACKLVVGNLAIPEENGKTIIFDSSYSHYAENNACADRIILYIDFKL